MSESRSLASSRQAGRMVLPAILVAVALGLVALLLVKRADETTASAPTPGPEARSPRAFSSDTDPETGGDPVRQEPAMAKAASPSITTLVASEELLLDLTPRLKGVAKGIPNLQLPDHHGRGLFADRVRIRDLAPGVEPVKKDRLEGVRVDIESFPPEPGERVVASSRLSLWRPLFDRIDAFDHAKLYLIRGSFDDEERTRWTGDSGFAARAWDREKRVVSVHGKQKITFAKDGASEWKIESWIQVSMEMEATDRLFFSEVTDEVLPDPALLVRARTSLHENLVRSYATVADFKPPTKYWSPVSVDRHPGLAVVDIDGDGFDDLYVMERWGKNLLLKNRGNGSFEDVAPTLGLDLDSHCSCALFADFDNDGDPDVMVGRTLKRSVYLENVEGKYVDRSREIGIELPYLVSSMAAADVDGDGLLDVYFSTYASDIWQRQWNALENLDRGQDAAREGLTGKDVEEIRQGRLLSEFLPQEEAAELHKRTRTGHPILARPGPPNVLLRNAGKGRFEASPDAGTVAIWHNTYQATFGDLDGDGDPDLYVANDFAPNHFFRNDEGRLVDVTDEVTADIGFGMGVSMGDYDNDGRQDLYVSNMFSKAGRRIASQLPDLDPRLAAMARGNSLLRNLGDHFEKVSGEEEGTVQVEVAGWAWGGQFLDVDNDGWLDVYALSGNYTPPREIPSELDV